MASNNVGWTTQERPDWGTVSLDGPPPLADACYKVKVIEAEPTVTSTNKPAMKVVVEALETYDGSDAVGYKKVFSTITCTNETAFNVLRIARTFDVNPPDDFGVEAVGAFCDELLGRNGYARIKPREYQGRKSNNLDRFLTSDEAAEQSAKASATEETQPRTRSGRRAAAAE